MREFNNIHTSSKNTSIIRRLRMIALTAAAVMLFAAMPFSVFAGGEGSENNLIQMRGLAGGAYEVTSYEMETVITKEHICDVEEKITVNIPEDLQQIEFAVPSGSFRMRNLSVDGVAFTSRLSSSGSTVAIADPMALTKGEHVYTIRYRLFEFADRNPERDILYFNVLLPEWRQPIANMSAHISLPEDFPMDTIQFYAGQFGVQDTENRLTFDINEASHEVSITGKLIPENFGITIKSELENGYWVGALDGIWAVFAMILVMGAAVLIMLVLWIIGGRDPRIKRVPQNKPIEGISPVELGYVFNNSFDGRDLVRMIIYFATRGYLRINEYEPKRYRLYRQSDPDGEEKLLRNAYGILFEDIYKGRALEMDDIGDRLLRIENTIRDDIAAGFSSKDNQAYTPLSKAFRVASIILTGVAAAVTNALKYSYQYVSINYIESVLFGAAFMILAVLLCAAVDKRDSTSGETGHTAVIIISFVTAAMIIYFTIGIITSTGHILAGLMVAALCAASIFFAVIMRARGKGNSVLIMRLRQLRRFISHPTPKELLENYLADPGYYYDMMIYALTFGSEESWAISFLTLDVPEPDWYSDDIEGHAFSNLRAENTTVDIARDIRSFVRTIEGAYEDMQRRRHRR